MSLSDIRKNLGLTQHEFAILTGVPVGTIRHYEQGARGSRRGVNPAFMNLVELLDSIHSINVTRLIRIACNKKYPDITQVGVLLDLLRKGSIAALERSVLEVLILENHPQFFHGT